MAEVEVVPFKVALCGKANVGKTSIFHRICNGIFPEEVNVRNQGIQYQEMSVTVGQDKSVKIQLWDTLGMERHAPLTRQHYVNSKVVLLVYDCDDMDSLELLEGIYDDAIDHAPEATMVLVRNKIDQEFQMVREEEAVQKLCTGTSGQRQRMLACHMATSALTGDGIPELCAELGDLLSNAEPVKRRTGGFLDSSESGTSGSQNSTSVPCSC